MTRFVSRFLILTLLIIIPCGTQQTLGQDVPHGETIFIPDDKNRLLLENYTTLSKEQIQSLIEPKTKRLGTYLNGRSTTFNADKTNAWYWLDAGLKYRYIKDNANALRSFNKGIEINPNIDLLYYNKSRVLLDTGQYDEAIMSLNFAILANPANVNNYVRKIRALDRVDRPKEALLIADLALERFPESHVIYLDRGTINLKLKNFSASVKDFDEYLKYDDKNDEAHLMKGVAHYHLRNNMLAESSFDDAIRINPQNRKAYDTRLQLYKRNIQLYYGFAMDQHKKTIGTGWELWQTDFKKWGDLALIYFRKYLPNAPDDNDMKLAFGVLILIDYEGATKRYVVHIDSQHKFLDRTIKEMQAAYIYIIEAAKSGDKKAQGYCKRFKIDY